MNPFHRRAAEQDSDVDFRRASGDCICEQCGRSYRDHPMGGPIGWMDEQFLHQLCDGSLVKL